MNKTTTKIIMILMTVIILGSTVMVSTKTAQAEAVKTDGYYITVVTTSKKNIPMDYPVLKKVSFEKNKFVSYGGFLYSKSLEDMEERTMKAQKRTFTLSKNCKYFLGDNAYDMTSSKKSISKKAFIKKLKKRLSNNKVNPDLVIKVKGKQVVRMYLQES